MVHLTFLWSINQYKSISALRVVHAVVEDPTFDRGTLNLPEFQTLIFYVSSDVVDHGK